MNTNQINLIIMFILGVIFTLNCCIIYINVNESITPIKQESPKVYYEYDIVNNYNKVNNLLILTTSDTIPVDTIVIDNGRKSDRISRYLNTIIK